jgi:hypothetical protein
MRKQLVVARPFPAQCRPKHVGIDLDEHQPGLAGEMLSGGTRDLRRGRKVYETVAGVVGTASIDALAFRRAPSRSGTDFIDAAHVPEVLLLLGFPGKFPDLTDRIGAPYALQGRPGRPIADFAEAGIKIPESGR